MKRTLPLIFCLAGFILALSLDAQVQTGKSYINVTKGTTGGTFEPGDVLEIRSAIAVGSSLTITQVRYNDTINSNFTYMTGSLKIITNEGLSFRTYTDAASDDGGMFDNTAKNLRMNLGSLLGKVTSTVNTSTGGGTIAYNNRPSFYGNVCIMVASFQVKINASLTYGTQLTLPGGAFRYTNGGSPVVVNFPANQVMLFQNLGSCSNFVGANALIENSGSFGSGTTQNRNSSAIIPGYTFVNFSSGQPNDGYYGIANNTSASGATNNGVAKPNSSRVFNIWDIIGDHTGAASSTAGNAAVAPGTSGGYMAVVNASYATSPAIQQTVANLCSNTYYDFSAYFRNICSLCACDSNGNGATSASFNGPYKPGVKPNLTFQLNGVDYYTTGDMAYTGLWEKKGFTYLTGSAENGFTLTIRNNSPGGGGNDWALDDVSLSTCEPNVDLNITPVLLGCRGVQVDFSVKVKCYFPNYTYYKWQKSTDGGATWTNTGIGGTGTPVKISGQWEYSATYPSFMANQADSGQRYRVVVATTAVNLTSGSCAYSNSQSTMLKIIDCAAILEVQLSEFSGQVINNKSNLKWSGTTENKLAAYEVERSDDGRKFIKAGSVPVHNSSNLAPYGFIDPVEIAGPVYYRLKMVSTEGLFKYSNIILLKNKIMPFQVLNVNNPFHNSMSVDYQVPGNGKLDCRLFDSYGKPVRELSVNAKKGAGTITLSDLNTLAAGIYTVTLIFENQAISKRVMKAN
jgi:hypothetical protein